MSYPGFLSSQHPARWGQSSADIRASVPGRTVRAQSLDGRDAILEGGLPRGRTTMLGGGPGSGKTVLAMEFLYHGAEAGEPGIFIAFEERAGDVRANAASPTLLVLAPPPSVVIIGNLSDRVRARSALRLKG